MVWENWVSVKLGLPTYGDSEEAHQAHAILKKNEIFDAHDVVTQLKAYLSSDPHSALNGKDPFAKCLAIIDRRVGTRALEQVRITDEDHSLVRRFLALRLDLKQTFHPEK
jgi:hypothetical protein